MGLGRSRGCRLGSSSVRHPSLGGGGQAGAGWAHGAPGCLPTVYWLAGAPACFTVCSVLFLLPFLLLRTLPPLGRAVKAE